MAAAAVLEMGSNAASCPLREEPPRLVISSDMAQRLKALCLEPPKRLPRKEVGDKPLWPLGARRPSGSQGTNGSGAPEGLEVDFATTEDPLSKR